MESTQLQKLVDERLEAVNIYRDTQDEATRWKAFDAIERKREEIDRVVVDLVKQREQDEARAAFEKANRIDPVKAEKDEERRFNQHLHDLLTGKRTGSILLPHKEVRTDYPLTTDTSDTTDYAFYNIATRLWNEIEYHENSESAIKAAGPKVVRTAGDGPLDIPSLTTDAIADTSPGAEVTAPTHSMYPVFGKTTLNSYRVQGFMTVSDEMLRSPDYPFYDVLAEIGGRALAVQEATFLARGTGSSQPKGLFACGTSAATAASTSTFTYPELVSVFYGPVEGIRKRGEWFLSTYAMVALMQMTDGIGRPVWSPSTVAGQPDTLFGRPIHEEAYGVASSISTGEKHVFFGDIKKFWVRYAGNLEIAASQHMRFNEWETVIRCALWMDCDMPDATGFYYLTQA